MNPSDTLTTSEVNDLEDRRYAAMVEADLETLDEHFDYFTSPTQGRWKIYGIGLPDDVLEKVYRGNARRVLTRR